MRQYHVQPEGGILANHREKAGIPPYRIHSLVLQILTTAEN